MFSMRWRVSQNLCYAESFMKLTLNRKTVKTIVQVSSLLRRHRFAGPHWTTDNHVFLERLILVLSVLNLVFLAPSCSPKAHASILFPWEFHKTVVHLGKNVLFSSPPGAGHCAWQELEPKRRAAWRKRRLVLCQVWSEEQLLLYGCIPVIGMEWKAAYVQSNSCFSLLPCFSFSSSSVYGSNGLETS